MRLTCCFVTAHDVAAGTEHRIRWPILMVHPQSGGKRDFSTGLMERYKRDDVTRLVGGRLEYSQKNMEGILGVLYRLNIRATAGKECAGVMGAGKGNVRYGRILTGACYVYVCVCIVCVTATRRGSGEES